MSVTIALAGDTMLGRGVAEQINATGTEDLFSGGVRDAFAAADLRVLNLECCVSARGDPWRTPQRPFHFRAPPDAVGALTELGIDCVTLANNHSLDYGHDAFTDTLDHLSSAGIATVGAGMDRDQAEAPAVLEAGGVRVAVLGLTDHPLEYAATGTGPGVAYMNLRDGVPERLKQRIRALAETYDVVLVTPHWGPNMTTEPLPYIREAARQLLTAGATLVAGHSAHVFHGVTGRVLFDLGDLIDDYATNGLLRNDLGLLFRVTIEDPPEIDAIPLRLEYAHTRLADDGERAWIRDRLTDACEAMGSRVTEHDDHLIIEAGGRRS